MIKLLFDIVGSLVLLVLFSPIFVLISLLVYLHMGSPILFRQQRPGKDKKVFCIYKFRTMIENPDKNTLSDEHRLTALGRVLRSLSLDELPQLINVLKGEMSFIGPRPLLIEYLPLYNEEQKRRHDVKPGITGWAQVNGRNKISWKKKFEYDLFYVQNLSFLLDMKILWLTIKKVLMRKDISADKHVTSEKFNGHN